MHARYVIGFIHTKGNSKAKHKLREGKNAYLKALSECNCRAIYVKKLAGAVR